MTLGLLNARLEDHYLVLLKRVLAEFELQGGLDALVDFNVASVAISDLERFDSPMCFRLLLSNKANGMT